MKTAILTMWLLLGTGQQPTTERVKNSLYESQSNCAEMARHLSAKGFGRHRCVPVRITAAPVVRPQPVAPVQFRRVN
jgi:hypothetical protein